MTAALSTAPAPRHSGAEIYRDLKRLQVVGAALYVAAHPDDENTRLLATLANQTLVRTAYLSFTRGEGGQNLIGQELGPLLGMIRTQELLAARRIDGAEQFFTRARDFGYSKSVDETLALWEHDAVLADAVFVIRSVRPDVIVTRFNVDGGDTHGHHTASARLALEAFTAAADPAFHPEQGLAPWRAKRIVWNAWSPDPQAKIDLTGAVQLDTSPYSPLLGYTFGELASDSRSMHKSQGFGAAQLHGPSVENFVLLGGDKGTSLFDGVDLTWAKVPGSQRLAQLLKQAADEFKVERPQASVPTLLNALAEMQKMPEHPWRAQKLAELKAVIADCAGIFVEAAATSFTVVPGSELELTFTALVRTDAPLKLKTISLSDGQSLPAQSSKAKLTVAAGTPLSTPEWLERAPSAGSWAVPAGARANAPERESALWADFVFDAFTIRRPIIFKWVDPTVGERYRPVEVLPPVVVKADAPVLVFTDNGVKPMTVTVTANADAQSGQLTVKAPTGWQVSPASTPFTLSKRGDTVALQLLVKPTGTATAGGSVQFAAEVNGQRHEQSLTRIEYAHVPMMTLLDPAQTKLVRVELSRGAVKRIGYVMGAGDDIPTALRQAGYEVTSLDAEALASKPLKGFDAIVLGVRAYNTNPKLAGLHARLMQYVSDGGTVVVQYNTKNRLSDVPPDIGPYPFDISRDRVTDETAVVRFALPQHPVLRKPNPLSPADFDHWVQERGLYFATGWAAPYAAPLSMNDPNEAERLGSLIIAKHGKGTFIYTGLAFFRQLPAGVPGAYRLFANLLAHGR